MMTEESSAESRWSRERWFLTVTIIFAVQVVVVIWLSERGDIPVKVDSQGLLTRYYTPEASIQLTPLFHLMDPTLYSRASSEGFSGSVWLDVKPIEHRSAGWSDPPQFLKFNQDPLLSDLERFGLANQPHRRTVSDTLGGGAETRVELSNQLIPSSSSVFEMIGDLRRTNLRSIPAIPSIELNGVLAPSIILLQVDQRGRVFSANLTGTSGQANADQQAMRIARALRFDVAEGFSPTTSNRDFNNLRRTKLIIHWATLSVPAQTTNTPPANPPTVGPVQ